MSVEYENLLPQNSNFSLPNKKHFKEDTSSINSDEIQKSRTLTENSFFSETKEMEDPPLKIDPKRLSLNDPQDQKFSSHYQIYFYIKNYFFFEYQGSLSSKEYIAQTKELRSIPLHLKMTLFTNEKNELIRKREFSFIEISFNEFKEKGNKLYNKGNYSQALEQYVEAYSLLKWIEVKDKTLLSYANIVQKQRAIVDGDIVKSSSYLNATDDDDTFNDCTCSILLSISYCFLQMRHYKNAVDCLDECLEIDENNVNALFRRSQARMYNKNSKFGDLEKSLKDIEKLLNIYKESNAALPQIYKEQEESIKELIEQKRKEEMEQIREFIHDGYLIYSKSTEKFRWKNEYDDESYKIQELQYNVLKIMKNKYKFVIIYYREIQNEEQLSYAYDEVEYFMERYQKFKFYYMMNVSKVLETYKNSYNENEKDFDYLEDTVFLNFLKNYKNKKSDGIFQDSHFNLELIKIAIGKVNQELKKQEILKNQLISHYSKDLLPESTKKRIELPEDFSFYISLMLLFFTLMFILVSYFCFLTPPDSIFEVNYLGRN